MSRLFILCCGVAISLTMYTFAQEECINHPSRAEHRGCCEPIKWGENKIVEQCQNSGNSWCYTECVFKETGLMLNGETNSTNINSFFQDFLKLDPDFIQPAVDGFKKCFLLVKQKFEKMHLKDEKDCNLQPLAVIDCVNVQLFANCPPKKWNATEKCEKLKTYYEKCPLTNYAV